MNTPIMYSSHNRRRNQGFTLFVALIVSSMLLAVGLSLGEIILKQLIFSSNGSQSQIAFYAADSGEECALYWDRKDHNGLTLLDGAFATSSLGVASIEDIYCGEAQGGVALATGQPMQGLVSGLSMTVSTDQKSASTTFYVDFSNPDNTNGDKACAKVTVSKWLDESNPANPIERTVIDSRGYNAPLIGTPGYFYPANDSQCDTSGPRVVERALQGEF